MKKWGIFVIVGFFLTLFGCEAPTPKSEEGNPPSPLSTIQALAGKSGSELFQATALGKSGKSCYSCHPDGEGLAGVGKKFSQDKELEKMINKCITGPLKGDALSLDSPEMVALATYLRTL